MTSLKMHCQTIIEQLLDLSERCEVEIMPHCIYNIIKEILLLPNVALCSVPGSGGYDAIYIIAIGESRDDAQNKIMTTMPSLKIL